MTRPSPHRVCLLLGALAACADPAEAEGRADDDVWDGRFAPVYRLTIDDVDWPTALWALHEGDTCEERAYMRAALEYDNPKTGETETYAEVGVRYRGHSSLDPDAEARFGLKISFDEYVDGQQFHGLRKLNFMGSEGDWSLLRERLAQGVMAAEGVPAPRVTHVRLFVNGSFYGIMPFPEEQDDDPYLAAHFDDDSGALFKVNGYCEGDGDFLYKDEEAERYAGRYEAKADTPDSAYEELLIPFIDCADDYTPDAFDTDSDVEMESCIEDWIDVDEWLAEMAVDVAVLDVDGMQATGQNYMLYFDPGRARFVVYPWDKDSTFRRHNADSPGDDSIWRTFPFWVGEEGRLPPAFPEDLRAWRAADYCAAVLDAADQTEDALEEIDRLEALLGGFLADDPAFGTSRDWADEAEDLREEIRDRVGRVRAEAEACTPPG